MKISAYRTYPLLLIGLFSVFIFSFMAHGNTAHAANTKDFSAANIIDNAVFRNNGSMSASQIQTFLNQKNSTCLKNYRGLALVDTNGNGHVEDWTTSERYGGPSGKATMSAAQIIKAASDIYKINPQVILVTLQKEQGLVTRSDCPDWRYNTALGYGCPDTAPCDQTAYGFTSQIDNGTYHFKGFYDNSLNYVPFTKGTYRISYNPDSRCGSTNVTIANEATAALYSYTPYQPNNYAKNGGTNDKYPSCGAFGNINFWKFFTDWFGSTKYTTKGAIGEKYTAFGGTTGFLGAPTNNEKCNLRNAGCYQTFENGAIYWSQETGAHYVLGAIRSTWGDLGYERSYLGYPTSDEQALASGRWQKFENGKILWKSGVGAYALHGAIGDKYNKLGNESGALGYPTSNEKYVDDLTQQIFENGKIQWNQDRETSLVIN